MTRVQVSASERDKKKYKGIWNDLRRSLEEDGREGDVERAETGWSPQHPC